MKQISASLTNPDNRMEPGSRTGTRNDRKAETRKRGNQERDAKHRERGGGDKTPRISPEATDHLVLRFLISTEALQAFVKPHRSALVLREALGTEVRKRSRSQALSLGSIETRAGSSKRQILQLSTGGKNE